MSVSYRSLQRATSLTIASEDGDEEQQDDEEEEERSFYAEPSNICAQSDAGDADDTYEDDDWSSTQEQDQPPLDQKESTEQDRDGANSSRRASGSGAHRRSLHDIMTGGMPPPTEEPSPPPTSARRASALPHFLRERANTMVESIPTQEHCTTMQSQASLFLLNIVQKSRNARPSSHDLSSQRPRNSVSRRNTVAPALSSAPAPSSSSRTLGLLTALSTASLPPARASPASNRRGALITRVSTGSLGSNMAVDLHSNAALMPHHSLVDLVHDLRLYRRDSVTLVAILQEILHMLQSAQDANDHDRLASLCKEVVDACVLPEIAAVLREFRFHTRLLILALTLLVVLTDTDDLYALLMSEIDLEPVIQKLVSVHGANEALVTMGATLFRAMLDVRGNAQLVQRCKEMRVEHEKQRVASFAQAVAAQIAHTHPSRVKTQAMQVQQTTGRAMTAPNPREQEHRQRDITSHKWRHALSAALGTPPTLTATYHLECAFDRKKALPPLPLPLASPLAGGNATEYRRQTKPRPVTSCGIASDRAKTIRDLAKQRSERHAIATARCYTPKKNVLMLSEPRQRQRSASSSIKRSRSCDVRHLATSLHAAEIVAAPQSDKVSGDAESAVDSERKERVSVSKQSDLDEYEDDFESEVVSEATTTDVPESSGTSSTIELPSSSTSTVDRIESDSELIEMIHEHGATNNITHEQSTNQDVSTPPESHEDSSQDQQAEATRNDADTAALVEMLDACLVSAPKPTKTTSCKFRSAGKRRKAPPHTLAGQQSRTGIAASPSDIVTEIQSLYARGLKLQQSAHLDSAIACYQRAIHLQQQHAPVREFASLFINLGSAWLVQGKYTEALGAFEQAHRIQPTNVKVLFNVALALLHLDQHPDALQVFERVVELDPSHAKAHKGIRYCQARLDHLAEEASPSEMSPTAGLDPDPDPDPDAQMRPPQTSDSTPDETNA